MSNRADTLRRRIATYRRQIPMETNPDMIRLYLGEIAKDEAELRLMEQPVEDGEPV
jgi:hypothetical protein